MANNDPSNNQSNFSEWVKNLWAPIAGMVGAITLVVKFIQLWQGDQSTVTLVTAIIGAALILLGLLWLALSRKAFEVPDFLSPDKIKIKIKSDWQYTSKIRLLSFAGIIVYLIVGGYGAYKLNQRRHELEAKTVILVATFDGPEDTYGVTNELLEQLDAAVADYEDIQVVRLGETITVEQGREYARGVGHRYLADIVIWGWYRPAENPNITIHVESLHPENYTVRDFSLIEKSEVFRIDTSKDSLESFVIQKNIGTDLGSTITFLFGFSLYKADDYQAALVIFEQTNNLRETNLISRPIILLLIGNSKLALGHYEQAISAYDEAINLDPNYEKLYYNRGLAYTHLINYEKAITDYDEAVRINPRYLLAYYGRAFAHYYLSQYELAIQDLNLTISIEPDYLDSYIFRGAIYLRLEEYEKAIDDLTKAIGMDPLRADAYLTRGTAYKRLGETQKASEDFLKVLELSTNPEWIQSAKDNLEDLGQSFPNE